MHCQHYQERRKAAATRGALLGLGLAVGVAILGATPAAVAVSSAPSATSLENRLVPPGRIDLMESAFQEGVALYESGDVEAAARVWRTPAEHGHMGAQFSLGVAYATGKGLPPNMEQAIHWWRAAAGQGHVAAQLNLGLLYWRGRGVEKDLDQARGWWRRAATGGDPVAQFHMGALAATGEGEPRNYKEAMRWWRLSAAQGYQQAIKGIEILKSHGAAPDEN